MLPCLCACVRAYSHARLWQSKRITLGQIQIEVVDIGQFPLVSTQSHTKRRNYSNGAVILAKTGCVLSSANAHRQQPRKKCPTTTQMVGPSIAIFTNTSKYLRANCFAAIYSPPPAAMSTNNRSLAPTPEVRHCSAATPALARKAQSPSTARTLFRTTRTQRCLGSNSNSLCLILNLKRCLPVHCCPFYHRLQLINVSTLPFDYIFLLRSRCLCSFAHETPCSQSCDCNRSKRVYYFEREFIFILILVVTDYERFCSFLPARVLRAFFQQIRI